MGKGKPRKAKIITKTFVMRAKIIENMEGDPYDFQKPLNQLIFKLSLLEVTRMERHISRDHYLKEKKRLEMDIVASEI